MTATIDQARIEAVARAIFKVRYPGIQWDDVPDVARDICEDYARAAIEADPAAAEMREALRQIATLDIDIDFMADHLIWAKGLASETLKKRGLS